MELQSVKELNANLKKRLEVKSNSGSKVVIHDDDDDLSGIKKESGFKIAINLEIKAHAAWAMLGYFARVHGTISCTTVRN